MKRDERRYHALIELVDTESGYLEHLRALVKVRFFRFSLFCLFVLAEEAKSGPIMRSTNINYLLIESTRINPFAL